MGLGRVVGAGGSGGGKGSMNQAGEDVQSKERA